ncbi:MAG: hypothetical protein JWL83_4430 [Actinomycetia bacterium]|nr:hypothetical protein [Actinomycetes bacterium]
MSVEMQPAEVSTSRTALLDLVATFLPLIALVMILGNVVQVFGLRGFSAREGFYLAALDVSSPIPALVALAAVVILGAGDRRADNRMTTLTRAGAEALSLLVVVAAVATIWHALTVHVHIPGPNSTNTASLTFGLGDGVWAYRLEQALRALSAAVPAGLTLYVSRRQRTVERDRVNAPSS